MAKGVGGSVGLEGATVAGLVGNAVCWPMGDAGAAMAGGMLCDVATTGLVAALSVPDFAVTAGCCAK